MVRFFPGHCFIFHSTEGDFFYTEAETTLVPDQRVYHQGGIEVDNFLMPYVNPDEDDIFTLCAVTPFELVVTDEGFETDTASTDTVTVTVDGIPHHNSIIVLMGRHGGNLSTGVTDSVGNTYELVSQNNGSDASEIWCCLDPITIPNNGTITAAWSVSTQAKYIHVFSLNKIAEIGVSGGANGVSTTPSVSTVGSAETDSVIFANAIWGPTNNAPSQAAGWTGSGIGLVGPAPGGNQQEIDGYKVVVANGVQTYAPVPGALVVWAATIAEFK